MKKPREALTEAVCPTCSGTGFQKVKQPETPGRRVYPPKCPECLGKGRIEKTQQQSGSAD
jgi:DnaJ-class molecular chaperone